MNTETIERLKETHYRVMTEQQEVGARLQKLEDFISSESFFGLPQIQVDLLQLQQKAMSQYNLVLCLRLRAIEEEIEKEK